MAEHMYAYVERKRTSVKISVPSSTDVGYISQYRRFDQKTICYEHMKRLIIMTCCGARHFERYGIDY